ncbi:MAG: hypothetical protein EBW59_06225 [Betaproteobacteria bacterium]|jgi:hypothetical protein|nr:hypothetical protein [Betaproteobacteria bacterium]
MIFFSSPYVIADQSDLSNFNDKEKSLKVIINEFTNTSNEEFNAFLQEKRNEMLSSVEQRFLNCDKDNDDTLDVFETTLCLPQVARQFRQVDSNKDNLISLDELSILAKEYYRDINKEALKKAKPNSEKFAKEN